MTKIRNKLLIAFILVSLIPLIALGGYALTSISGALRDASNNSLKEKVTLVSFGIEDVLKNVTTDLFYLRDSTPLSTFLDTGMTEQTKLGLERDFLAFSRHKKIYHQIRFLDTRGEEIVRVDRNNGESKVVPRNKLQNKKDRYYYADTIKLGHGELMISPLDLNHEHGQVEKPLRPVIRYGTPVFDNNKRLQGIVLFNVLADTFLEFVRKENSMNEQGFLVSNDGFYFVNPDTEKEWGGESDLNTGSNFSNDYPTISGAILGATSFKETEHKDYIIASTPVFVDKEKNKMLGTVVDAVPVKDVFSSVTTFRNVFLLIGACVFLATLLLAIGLAKSITDPIVYLTEVTHNMSKGKLSAPVAVKTKDETRVLAESIELLRKSMNILLKRMSKK